MSCLVCMGATLQCSFGAAPSTLVVIPTLPVLAPALPAATIRDSLPLANVLPFGVCTSMSNPMVAAATAAALGVLVPQPCIPVTPAPWLPGRPTVLIGGVPALDQSSKLMCAWGGVVSVVNPGQVNTQLP
jgi:hypothetical protein